jgi:hypothetical protein
MRVLSRLEHFSAVTLASRKEMVGSVMPNVPRSNRTPTNEMGQAISGYEFIYRFYECHLSSTLPIGLDSMN